jgi:transposase
MRFDLENLPSDTALLHRLVREMAVVVDGRDDEIERLQLIIKKLQRAQFRRRSERLDADQLALALKDLDGDIARIRESRPIVIAEADDGRPKRKPLPDHLPREDILLAIAGDICGCCGGALHAIGESVSEMLDWVPAQLRVIRITRPKYACRSCNKVEQAAAPERLIAGGLATPALLAQVLVGKYCDHTPLYRQSQIFARHGVDLSRFDAGRMGWRRLLVAGSAARAIVQKRIRLRPSLRRRHPDPGARSGPRKMGYYSITTSAGKSAPAVPYLIFGPFFRALAGGSTTRLILAAHRLSKS